MALVSLDDVRDACNIIDGDTSKDVWLLQALDAASTVIVDIVGTVEAASATWSANGGGVAVVLPETPVTVTSVTVDGEPWTDYGVSGSVVYAASGSAARRTTFPAGIRNVAVAYTSGSATVPAPVVMATTELVRHWFQNGQQGSRPSFGGAATEPPGPGTYAVPRRIYELLEPYMTGHKLGMA